MSDPTVDDLRQQLKERGYLTHGIERWFALDPWSSRAFWMELAIVAAKAAVLIAAFGLVPPVAVMLTRNHPLSAMETLELALLYAAACFFTGFVLIVIIAFLLKLRPALAIDTPRTLLVISLGTSAVLTACIAIWWFQFDSSPSLPELIAGAATTVIFLSTTTIVVSAALLSFSIYELHRVPAIHRRSRAVPMTVAAAILVALLFLPAYAATDQHPAEPPQVVTTPTQRRVALIAVDGLTFDVFASRPDLARQFTGIVPASSVGGTTTERWASVGTGTPAALHDVRSVEGIRFRGGRHVLQSISRADIVLRAAAPALGLADRQVLPPTVRHRDYVWEIFARRGVTSAAVNWWTTATSHGGSLDVTGQEPIFAAARGDALRVDEATARAILATIDRVHPQFATVYLPALDVILNRLALDRAAQLAASVRALDGIAAIASALRARGYEVMLIGLPGDHQAGNGVMAATFPLETRTTVPAFDLAPTLCTVLGFPASREMPGHSLVPSDHESRIDSYGDRAIASSAQSVNQEYYENLRSLGYIR
ncbi:MAG: alkaline phosphatase family protein [Thermoanaerobaculia bacterium]